MSHYRLENKRFEKNIKFFKWGAIITLFLAIIRIAFDADLFQGSAKLGDFMLSLIPIMFFIQYRKTAKKWSGQFIEWSDSQILFKTREYDKTTVELDDINSIEIKLDRIILRTKEEDFEINIEDYTEYEDRLQLKNNFERIKEKLEDSSTL